MTRTAAPAAPHRPAFRDGQVLRADDLGDESAAVVEAARRHQQFAHLPGVVAGLWLARANDVASVSPGMAIDAAGRTILVPRSHSLDLPKSAPPTEVWIAHREDQRPERVSEGYELLSETPGRYDPRRPGDHPLRAVFLGTVGTAAPDHAGRVYVGAVGARIDSPSGRARLLLGPEGPGDLRLFAVGTPGANPGEYRDHLTVDSTGAVRFTDPVTVAARQLGSIAAVAVGLRPSEFQTKDILDPAGLWRAAVAAGVIANPGRDDPPGGDRLRALLARLLNQKIAGAREDGGRGLEEDVRRMGVPFRPETVRLLQARNSGTPRTDPRRLARLLLEDAFPAYLGRLRAVYDGPLGVGFVGRRPTPASALPGCAYLTVADKAGTQRELRLEVEHPGKDNNPERYWVAIGAVGPDPADTTKTRFDPALTADAGGTVTIFGNLRVYPPDPSGGAGQATGLIVKVEKPASPDAPPGKAANLGLVSPVDLAIKKLHVEQSPDGSRLTLKEGFLFNSGEAAITDVQLHATVFATDLTTGGVEPETTPLVRGLVIGPKAKAELVDPNEPKPNNRLVVLIDQTKLHGLPITFVLSAYGYGPGFVPVSAQRKLELPDPTP